MTDVMAYLEAASQEAASYDPVQEQEFDTVRFRVQKSVLLNLMDKVSVVIPAKTDNAALTNFLVQVTQDSLKITGTDKSSTILIATKMFEPIALGTILLPAKTLMDILRSVEDDLVDIEVVNKSIIIVIGGASWELRSLEGLNFPSAPAMAQAKPVKVNRHDFIMALNSVKYAVAKDSARPGLKMVDLKANKMTACDGVRFQQAEVSAPAMQIAGSSIELVLKILSASASQEIIFAELPKNLVFRVDTTILIITKPEVKFPHAEQLFLRPALTNDQELKVSRQSLIKAIKKVRLCADEDTSAIALKLTKNSMEISTRDQLGNKATETIEASWKGKSRTLIVHHRFLLEMLSVNDMNECVFKLGDDTANRKSPILLQNSEAKMTGVIQQMLLGSLTGYAL